MSHIVEQKRNSEGERETFEDEHIVFVGISQRRIWTKKNNNVYLFDVVELESLASPRFMHTSCLTFAYG